jgi:hypothetical protein
MFKLNSTHQGPLLLGALYVTGLLSLSMISPRMETRLFPVNKDCHVTEATVTPSGVLVISGNMVKQRQCQFLPPTKVRTDTGLNLAVYTSDVIVNTTWLASPKPQKWGPWSISTAGATEVTLYQEHRCNIFWNTISELGTVNLSKIRKIDGPLTSSETLENK